MFVGSDSMTGVSTSVSRVEKARPKMIAVDSWTHQIEVIEPSSMTRLM